MGQIHTGAVKGLSRAPYRVQVECHLIDYGCSLNFSPEEEAKIARVQRFLSARHCAQEIRDARERKPA